jgi:hypothetical protein
MLGSLFPISLLHESTTRAASRDNVVIAFFSQFISHSFECIVMSLLLLRSPAYS